nr:immunoglobulin light chain junction region [Macaca mulatta]
DFYCQVWDSTSEWVF